MQQTKKCKGKCQQVKPLTDFHKKCNATDGYQSECKECVKEKKSEIFMIAKEQFFRHGF